MVEQSLDLQFYFFQSQGCVWFGPLSEDGFASSLLQLAKALTVGTLMGAQVVVKDRTG
jgi:hypothetical protein